ncbi:hypothetical protein INR49_002571 [Caranx melampygus]|nr:hypothetical protein INR49_002571 [Caranx melampygus]
MENQLHLLYRLGHSQQVPEGILRLLAVALGAKRLCQHVHGCGGGGHGVCQAGEGVVAGRGGRQGGDGGGEGRLGQSVAGRQG